MDSHNTDDATPRVLQPVMIQKYADRFLTKKDTVKQALGLKHPDSYGDLVKLAIETIREKPYEDPDPARIHEIDDGDYQGSLVYVIAGGGYQPSTYWAAQVDYGSCSGCDTIQGIRGYSGKPPTEQQVEDYYTLALHIVQGLKQIFGGSDD